MSAADLRTFSWSYHQRGIVATVRTERPNDTAWQRFLGTGPLALLPVRDGYSNVVWSTSVAEAARLEALTPQEFALNVNQVGVLLLVPLLVVCLILQAAAVLNFAIPVIESMCWKADQTH